MTDIPNGFTGFSKMGPDFQYRRPSAREEGEEIPFDEEELASIPARDRRWSWVEIDTGAIRANTREIKRRLKPGCRLMAVVKADGYGHGAIPCAKAALSSGADCLGVATVDEGIALRKARINVPVLILSEPPSSAIPLLLHYKLIPSIYTPDFAIDYGETADRHGMKAPYHLAVNTGMNRIGVRHDEVVSFMSRIAFHRALEHVGTYTHFATADCEELLDFQLQVRRFVDCIKAMKAAGLNPGIIHAANSAAIIRFPEVHFDMVRLGISLYGFHPCPETRTMIQLYPAMSVHCRITDVRTLGVSEGVSYGLTYRSPGNVKVCTLPIGYADGLRRGLSSRMDVIYGGHRFPQVGTICMDQCMFEVDQRKRYRSPVDPKRGDLVTIIGRQGDSIITIDDMAYALATNQHEIAIGFATRMPRYWS